MSHEEPAGSPRGLHESFKKFKKLKKLKKLKNLLMITTKFKERLSQLNLLSRKVQPFILLRKQATCRFYARKKHLHQTKLKTMTLMKVNGSLLMETH
jgi:hypothetical protein